MLVRENTVNKSMVMIWQLQKVPIFDYGLVEPWPRSEKAAFMEDVISIDRVLTTSCHMSLRVSHFAE